jgi:hypothetical protein
MTITITEEKTYEYKTQSLDEFAVSLALGAEIVGVDRLTDPRFFTFNIKATFDVEKSMLSLASKTLDVNAYALCDAMRRAKSLIHRRPIS